MKTLALAGTVLFAAAVLIQCTTSSYDTDGESIFHTGKTLDCEIVENEVDRSGLPDSDVILACANCHGDDAKGGKNTIPAFGPYVAPSITWKTLTAVDDGVPYTVDSFTLTLLSGIAPEGHRLHHPMPVWKVTPKQAQSIAEYLQTK